MTNLDDENGVPPDEQRPPRLIPGRGGTRMYSLAALLERIVSTFESEHGGVTSDTPSQSFQEAESVVDKRKLVRDTVNYVVSVEAIVISPQEQADIAKQAYSELFGFGPLDDLFSDETVTTIALEGIDRVSVRRGHGELTVSDLLFEDIGQLRRVIGRLLRLAGAELRDDQSIIEAGLTVNERPVSLNLVGPPLTPQLTADIRVHPRHVPTLEACVEDSRTRELLAALARSPHGYVIVGEPESSKTTLLAALLSVSGQSSMVSVERAGELRLPDGGEQLIVQWPLGDVPGITFSERVVEALEKQPSCIVLDEVRADESAGIAPLLLPDSESPPRLIWTFRGPAESKRLTSALTMVARRADSTRSEALVKALYERLPFIITVRRRKDRVQVYSIAEWQRPDEAAEYPDYVELMTMGWEALETTGKRPSHDLDLPPDFWGE